MGAHGFYYSVTKKIRTSLACFSSRISSTLSAWFPPWTAVHYYYPAATANFGGSPQSLFVGNGIPARDSDTQLFHIIRSWCNNCTLQLLAKLFYMFYLLMLRSIDLLQLLKVRETTLVHYVWNTFILNLFQELNEIQLTIHWNLNRLYRQANYFKQPNCSQDKGVLGQQNDSNHKLGRTEVNCLHHICGIVGSNTDDVW